MEPVKIGITMGDPSGIGPEIIAKVLAKPEINKLGKTVIIGDRWVFDKINPCTTLPSLRPSLRSGLEDDSERSRTVKNPQFIDCENVSHKNFKFGKVKAEYGRASIEYLKMAVELIKNNEIDCLVTAPISKAAVNMAGYKYNGHTEFLAWAFGKKKEDIVMMLLNKYLKISLVTRHLALSKVSSALNPEVIYKTIAITHRALRDCFAIPRPKIYVAALNPHAGEGGLLGKEEIKKILPAIKRAKRSIKEIFGPIPADSIFYITKQAQFDAVIAMYHDQALIPLKVLDPGSGVNLTLGIGIVRTSPLHGTGFDIAGKNIAGCASLIAAIKTAAECTLNLKRVKRKGC